MNPDNEAAKQPRSVIVVTYWAVADLGEADPTNRAKSFAFGDRYADTLDCARAFAAGVKAAGGVVVSIVSGVLVEVPK